MDNFLHDFRDLVNRVKKPDSQPSDWESFKAYRAGQKSRQNQRFLNRTPKKLITGIAVTLIIAISLLAYFALPSGYDRKTLVDQPMENKDLNSKAGTNEPGAELTEQGNKMEDLNTIAQKQSNSKELQENKQFPESSAEILMHADGKRKVAKGIHSKGKTAGSSGEEFVLEKDLTPDLIFLEKQVEFVVEGGKKKSGLLEVEQNIGQNIDTQIGMLASKPVESIFINQLQKRNFSISERRQEIELGEVFSTLNRKGLVLDQPKIQLGVAAHFIIPFKDRIDASFHTGMKVFANYQITDKLSMSVDWSKSGYTRTIPDKKMYPSLDEINPRSTEDKLEELTVDASISMAGIHLNYDILEKGRLVNSVGVGFQRDISARFDFKMHVRDKMGKPDVQRQHKNIIPKTRYFLSPRYQVSYQVLDHVNLHANVQYDISLATFSEKYMNIDIGAAYMF